MLYVDINGSIRLRSPGLRFDINNILLLNKCTNNAEIVIHLPGLQNHSYAMEANTANTYIRRRLRIKYHNL